MLTYRQLEDAGEAIVRVMAEVEQAILNEMARRIGRLGELEGATNWPTLRHEIISNARQAITKELFRGYNVSERRIIELFDEAATRTLDFDNRVYRAAGLTPTPLAESQVMQQIVRAGVTKTLGAFHNLTMATAHTATRQFERTLDLAHQLIASGRYTYEQAIREGIRSLARSGIEAIHYPTGRVDRIDVAFRRAALTGINQTAAEVQLANIAMMGTDLVEVTAHPGARPDHMLWQGKRYSISGTHPKYPCFKSSTGYGTALGLCGINCRHSFFPFFEGLSDPAYTPDKLREYNNKCVTYKGKEMSLYDATQRQRYIERQIRHWKREASAYDAVGLNSTAARARIAYWQSEQRDFVGQTGLTRDYFRERGGVQNLHSLPRSGIITLDSRGRETFASMDYNDVKDLRVSNLAARQWYNAHVEKIPQMVDNSLSLEQQARQSHELRNQYRTKAREIMSDTQTRDMLNEKYPHLTFDELLQSNIKKGMSMSEAYEDIIRSAATPDKRVNTSLGLE